MSQLKKKKIKFKIKKKPKKVVDSSSSSSSETENIDFSTSNTECLTGSKNISADLDLVNPRLEITDEQGGWVNLDRMDFIDWLNNIYSKMETDTFSQQQSDFNEALSRKDLIANRLKPFFVKEHQHFVMDFLHKKSPYKGLLFYHGLGSGKTAASIATADGLHENGNQIIVMLPASLKTNYLEEIKVFGDALLRQKAYWCKVTLPSKNASGYKALVDELVAKGLPKKILLEQGYGWLIDEEKTKNGDKNTPEEVIEIQKQIRYLIRLKYNFIHYNASNVVTSLFDYKRLLKYRPERFSKSSGDLTPNCLFPIPDKEKKSPTNQLNYYDELLEILQSELARKPRKTGSIDVKTKHRCPYSKLYFKSSREKRKHIKECVDIMIGIILMNPERYNPFNGKTVIIDEVHNLSSKVVGSGYNFVRLYALLMSSVNSRFIFLSGTPLINSPFEITVIMNLLKGRIKNYMIDFDYRGKNITNGIIDPDELERLQEDLLNNVRNVDQIKIIQNRISNTKTIVQITVSQLPNGFRPVIPVKKTEPEPIIEEITETPEITESKPEKSKKSKKTKKSKKKSKSKKEKKKRKTKKVQTGSSDFTDTMTYTDGIVYDSSELISTDSVNNYNINSFIDKISNIAKDYGLVLEKQGRNTYKPKKYSLHYSTVFPEILGSSQKDPVSNLSSYLRDGLQNAEGLFSQQHISPESNEYKLVNTKQFTKKILGCVSYYNRSIGNFPDVFFNKYETVQEKVVYPDGRVEMIPKKSSLPEELPMSQYQEEKYIRVRQEEKEKESFSDIQNEIAEQSKKSGSSSVYRVFSRQCSTFVFPNHILRPKVTKISDSALARDGDKHRLLAKKTYDERCRIAVNRLSPEYLTQVKPMYDFYKESSIYKTIRNYLNTSNVSPLLGNINLLKYFIRKNVDINNITEFLVQYEKEQDPEYFSFKGKREQDMDTSEKEKKYYAINTEEPQIEYDLSILSPKYSKIIDNVNTSPGLTFLYSQFRRMEGLELFSKIMDYHGYAKYHPKNSENKRLVNNQYYFTLWSRIVFRLQQDKPELPLPVDPNISVNRITNENWANGQIIDIVFKPIDLEKAREEYIPQLNTTTTGITLQPMSGGSDSEEQEQIQLDPEKSEIENICKEAVLSIYKYWHQMSRIQDLQDIVKLEIDIEETGDIDLERHREVINVLTNLEGQIQRDILGKYIAGPIENVTISGILNSIPFARYVLSKLEKDESQENLSETNIRVKEILSNMRYVVYYKQSNKKSQSKDSDQIEDYVIDKNEDIILIDAEVEKYERLYENADDWEDWSALDKPTIFRARYAFWTGMEDKDERLEIKEYFNNSHNTFGQDLRILMTTAAGSEGISLQNVRHVHIIEPYWNRVRVDQVIGRAARLDSHNQLPLNERNVSVYEYVADFNDAIKVKSVLGTREEYTSDKVLFLISKKKNTINNKVVKLLKEGAVDCEFNSEVNTLTNDPVNCFKFPKQDLIKAEYQKSEIQKTQDKKQPTQLNKINYDIDDAQEIKSTLNIIRVIVGNLSPFQTGFNVKGEQIALKFKIELLKVVKSGETLPILDGNIIDVLQGQQTNNRNISLNRISYFRFVYDAYDEKLSKYKTDIGGGASGSENEQYKNKLIGIYCPMLENYFKSRLKQGMPGKIFFMKRSALKKLYKQLEQGSNELEYTMKQIMGARGTSLMRYYIDNRLDADETLVGKHDYTKEPKNYKLELKAFTKQVKKLLKLRQLEEAEKKAILEQLMNREKFNKEEIIALMEQQKMKNRIPTLLSKKQVNKEETLDIEQSQPPVIDTKEPIQQDNQETEVTVETDIEYGVIGSNRVPGYELDEGNSGNISIGRRFRYENVDNGNIVDIYREGQSMELCGLHAINNMLGQNLEYMPSKQPYLANQLHTIATEMEQTEVGRASGQTFHTSSGQFNTDVLKKALRDSGWKLFKQWYPDSDKELDVEIQPLFDLDMQYNSLELVACDPPSEDCIRSNGVLGYLLCNVDKEDSDNGSGHWTSLTRSPTTDSWVFVNSIESRTTNLFNPDDDHRYTIQGDFNTFKTNLEAISAELGFTIKQVIVVYNNNEEEGYDRLQEQLQQETAGNSRYRTEVLKYFRKKCKKEMVGSDLKDQINRVLGETPDRQIISDYIQWRKSEQGSDKKFRHYLRQQLNVRRKELEQMPCREILQRIGFI